MADPAAPSPNPAEIMRSRQFLGLLVIAAVLGVIASAIAWGFLELVVHMQTWVFTDIPEDLGFETVPLWWSVPILGLAGVVTAFAIVRLPGRGGHLPADGLNPAPTRPIDVPGVILAAVATIGLGLVLGPEAPLIAIGGGLGLLAASLLRGDAPPEVSEVLAASAILAALAFLFGSPIVAALILIEAAGLGGSRLPLVLVPGLLASGIGSLVWIGMGSWTGLDTAEISIGALDLPAFARPDAADFAWTIPLAIAVAVVTFVIFRIARETARLARSKPFLVTPAVGLAVAGLAIAFSQTADKGVNQVLFSGETTIDSLVANPGAWSLSALALLIAFKGLAYGLSLGSFRGGPVFPALFLGAAGGMMAAQLPGFDLTPAIAVGMGAAVVAVLRLPLSAAVLAVILTSKAGPGAGPVIIVGVVVAYLTTLVLAARLGEGDVPAEATPETSAPAAAGG
jgi:H+/Cl- antiporter ClcA